MGALGFSSGLGEEQGMAVAKRLQKDVVIAEAPENLGLAADGSGGLVVLDKSLASDSTSAGFPCCTAAPK